MSGVRSGEAAINALGLQLQKMQRHPVFRLCCLLRGALSDTLASGSHVAGATTLVTESAARLVHGGQQVVAARLQQHQGVRQVVDVLRRARKVRELRHLMGSAKLSATCYQHLCRSQELPYAVWCCAGSRLTL